MIAQAELSLDPCNGLILRGPGGMAGEDVIMANARLDTANTLKGKSSTSPQVINARPLKLLAIAVGLTLGILQRRGLRVAIERLGTALSVGISVWNCHISVSKHRGLVTLYSSNGDFSMGDLQAQMSLTTTNPDTRR